MDFVCKTEWSKSSACFDGVSHRSFHQSSASNASSGEVISIWSKRWTKWVPSQAWWSGWCWDKIQVNKTSDFHVWSVVLVVWLKQPWYFTHHFQDLFLEHFALQRTTHKYFKPEADTEFLNVLPTWGDRSFKISINHQLHNYLAASLRYRLYQVLWLCWGKPRHISSYHMCVRACVFISLECSLVLIWQSWLHRSPRTPPNWILLFDFSCWRVGDSHLTCHEYPAVTARLHGSPHPAWAYLSRRW